MLRLAASAGNLKYFHLPAVNYHHLLLLLIYKLPIQSSPINHDSLLMP